MKVLIIVLLLVILVLLSIKTSDFKENKWHSDTELVIVTAHYKEDLNWLKNSYYPVVLCDKSGADASPFDPDPKCSIPFNKGREASSYLKFIIEYYDELPKYVAFIHGHEDAFHHKLPWGILEALDKAKKNDYNFISLNNILQITCSDYNNISFHSPIPGNIVRSNVEFHTRIENAWDEYFKPILGYDCPKNIRHQCCAQFVVSRQAILRNSKSSYEKLYKFMTDGTEHDGHQNGFVMEYVWHMIFGENPDMCSNDNDELYSECTDEIFLKSRYT
jgi:hypothetical protein